MNYLVLLIFFICKLAIPVKSKAQGDQIRECERKNFVNRDVWNHYYWYKKKKKKDILGSQGLLNIKDGAFR